VRTKSDKAIKAQQSVMEFLLINHPLDCPICDQGGECQLQDLAVGYGASSSRYQEEKRVVVNKNLGPLIATDMTRCIHCTRCVRFGQEIAGIMELGMAGRGEHSEILAFVGRTVDSELSGNVIDLCPVGALTSKPFRFSARNWELSRRKSVSAHDAYGSNLMVQVKNDRVMRVLPLRNESVNEFWLSDRDRFAYEGLNSDERLTRPMVKRAGAWAEVDWPEALEAAAQGLKDVVTRHGPQGLGTLLAPSLTLEELHLAAKLARGLGSENIDHRIRQSDFRVRTKGAPWLGMAIADVSKLKSILLVGSTVRKELPLFAARLRQGTKSGLVVNTLHVVADDLLMPVAKATLVKPGALAAELAKMAEAARDAAPAEGASAIVLGHYAQQHPDFAAILSAAHDLGRATGAAVGLLSDGANAAGAHLVGALPGQGGLDARAMVQTPRPGYLIAGIEAEYDMGAQAAQAIGNAEFVVALSSYRNGTTDRAHVLLPIAPFTETAGSFVSLEGRAQSFNAVVKPLGDTRPGWKVLRMLGSMLGLPGFDAEMIEDVRRAIAPDLAEWARAGLDNAVDAPVKPAARATKELERIAEMGIYAGDPIVRRAASLQKTTDAKASTTARFHPTTLASLGLAAGDRVRVRQGGGEAVLAVRPDAAVPEGCVRIARGVRETARLGEGEISVAKERSEVAA
jgi:NADH-quinone oxidoreductase subunit G